MDHCSLIMSVPLEVDKVRKSFKFFNFMLGLEGFEEAVIDA